VPARLVRARRNMSRIKTYWTRGSILALATLLIVGFSDTAQAADYDKLGCTANLSGTTYLTLNAYEIAGPSFFPGSNNFVSYNYEIYLNNAYQSGGTSAFDNRFSREANGCSTPANLIGTFASPFTAGQWRVIITIGSDDFIYNWNAVSTTTAVATFQSNTQSRIINTTQPQNNQVYDVDEPVTIAFNYYNGTPNMTDAGVIIKNLSFNQLLSTPTTTITVSGEDIYTFTAGFSDGFYSLQPYLINGTSTITGNIQYFTVGSTTQFQSPFVPPNSTSTDFSFECDLENIVTNSICNVFGFLIIPSGESLNSITQFNQSLSTKFPFVYIYQVNALFQSLYTQSTTQSLSITMDFGGLGDLTLINASQIEAVP